MSISRRTTLAIGVLVVLGAFVALGRWYQTTRALPAPAATSLTVRVTSGGDRGPGSLREAVFVADAAAGAASIVLAVPHIELETTLPPLVNHHGVQLSAAQPGTEIDAHALSGGPVFDVDGPNTSISGVTIRNCPATGILVRAARFRLEASAIESCDVGVDVAENISDIALERNRFTKGRIGVRFAASSANTVVVKNEFSAETDAGVWAVRSQPDLRSAAISVRDNKFADQRLGIVAGNVSLLVEHNDFSNAREAAVHLIGAGVVVRGNHIRAGAAMGIVAENARGAIIDSNELDHIAVYAIMVRGSANTLVHANRIDNCGYGLAFVLGDASNPSTAADNSLFDLKYNGIDIIGDSPILRHNRVLQAKALPLHVADYQPPDGKIVPSHPLLENNTLGADGTTVASKDAGGLRPGVTSPR